MTRPHMVSRPATVSPSIVFRTHKVLNKEVWISDKSKLVVALKKPKKSPTKDKEFPAHQLADAVNYYLDMKKHRAKNTTYFLLVHTDELTHEFCIESTDD